MSEWTPDRLRELSLYLKESFPQLDCEEGALDWAADEIERLKSHNNAYRKRLRADKRRLDWLDDERFASWANRIVADTNPGTLREAIDAAMGGDDETG